ncbi:probable pectin methylesterase CGR2 [Prosopis cineraria]|uniref:probable pectin methylesterase CGR2 n=1 Tax=Prosopis cineraria TaxID=364024 RepID=UPI00240FC985|nr:probable pectin methylesterase CGR2 [Prosopis cineraria]
MLRRQVSSARRGESMLVSGFLHSKSRSSPLLSIGLVLLGVFFLAMLASAGSGLLGRRRKDVSMVEGDGFSCTAEVQRAIPVLKKSYGNNMKKILHVGPDSCSVVSNLLREEETEAWGVEPYDIEEDVNRNCKALVQTGIVRVADIKFSLPYRAKSFSHVIVSDALDYLSPKNLNKTLPELARVSSDGVVIFTGYPGQQSAKVAQLAKFGRPAKMRSTSWWTRFFTQTSLLENEAVSNRFEQAASKMSYKPFCQIFHLSSHH